MNRTNASNFIAVFQVLAVLLLSLASGSLAAADVLVRGDGVVVTTDDVMADTERVPAELRKGVLISPPKLEQLTANIYVRRAMAKRARESGLDKDPRVLAAQQLANDKVLSDAYLAKVVAEAQPANEAALEKQARAYYAAEGQQFQSGEERKVRHILIAKAVENPEAKAREVLEKLQHGADFDSLAKEYSADPGTKDKGGDLGYFGRGRMVKPFEDAAFGLTKPGELAGPVETPFGWHILRLDAIRPPGKKPYEEVSADIKQTLLEKIASERRVGVATEIRSKIEFDQPAIESFAKHNQ